ncbi:hypothetical protein BLOT_010138 [Blomia tropicalis]|nr:hypothetical protein BLOT_010138 [Blomia tropicalis]
MDLMDSTLHANSNCASSVSHHQHNNNNKINHNPQREEFETSVNEIYQFKQCISLKIKQLEQAIDRLKSVILVYDHPQQQQPPSSTKMDETSIKNRNSSIPTNGTNDNQAESIDELRKILTDIDCHLAVLKDVEERHSLICESYSHEIRARDETLQAKTAQIMAMNVELGKLQTNMNLLVRKNRHLETEIKIVKATTDDEKLRIPLPYLPPNEDDNEVEGENLALESQKENGIDYKQMYNVLLKQYKQMESSQKPKRVSFGAKNHRQQPKQQHHLINMNRTNQMKLMNNNTNNCNNNQKELIEESITRTNQIKPSIPTLSTFNDVEMNMGETLKTNLIIPQLDELKTNENVDQLLDVNLKTLMDKPDSIINDGQESNETSTMNDDDNDDGKQLLLTELENKSNQLFKDFGLTIQKSDCGKIVVVDGNVGSIPESTRTAFELLATMQHELQSSTINEERYRLRCEQLELENESIRTVSDENDFKLSEVQYELDILKHNYNLEMESFSTAVNERESLIEKMQQKVEALKRRYQTLDDRLQASIEKEVQYKATIEEAEGRVQYEQLQRKTMIDSRINELELKLSNINEEHETIVEQIRHELGTKCRKEIELNQRIEELECSLKNLVLNNTISCNGNDENGSHNGDDYGECSTNVAIEDEFSYYKNRIDALNVELESERSERQRLMDRFDEEMKIKDRTLDQLRDQLRKDKDSFLVEKNEFDQRYRKMAAKFKVKEREISSLQEKLHLLNERFVKGKNGETINENEIVDNADDNNQKQKKTEEQLLTELALNEAQLSEMRTRLENAEEHLNQLNTTLQCERDRRRELESHYLVSIGNGGGGGGGAKERIAHSGKGLFWNTINVITGSRNGDGVSCRSNLGNNTSHSYQSFQSGIAHHHVDVVHVMDFVIHSYHPLMIVVALKMMMND